MPFVYTGKWTNPEALRAVIPTESIIADSQAATLKNARLIHRRSVRLLFAAAPRVSSAVVVVPYVAAPVRTSRDTPSAQRFTVTGFDCDVTLDVYDAGGVLVGSVTVALGAAPAINLAALALALVSDSTYYCAITVTPTAAIGALETLRFEES